MRHSVELELGAIRHNAELQLCVMRHSKEFFGIARSQTIILSAFTEAVKVTVYQKVGHRLPAPWQ
jgi:hypothetical protein